MGAIEIITLFMEVIFNANGFILNSIIVSFRISLYSIFLMLSKVLFLTEKCQENSHSFQSAVIICLFNLLLITDFSLLYCWLLKDKDHIIKVIPFQRHACDWIKSVNNNNHNSERNFRSQSNSRSSVPYISYCNKFLIYSSGQTVQGVRSYQGIFVIED